MATLQPSPSHTCQIALYLEARNEGNCVVGTHHPPVVSAELAESSDQSHYVERL